MINGKTLRIAAIRKQLHNNYNNFKSNNEFLHHNNKAPSTTPTQRGKETAVIAGDSVLPEVDDNRLSGAKSNSVKLRTFRVATLDDMKDFVKPYLKRSPTNIVSNVDINNSTNDSSSVFLNKFLSLKIFIHIELL